MGAEAHHREAAALLRQLCDISPSELKGSAQIRGLKSLGIGREELLSAIPTVAEESYQPLHLLHTVLTELPGPWPAFALIRCYTRLFRSLPEGAKGRQDGEVSRLIDATSKLVKASYTSFAQFIGNAKRPALRSTSPDSFMTYHGLQSLVENLRLPVGTTETKPVVAIALPNGPLLAAMCIATATYYTSAPINQAAGPDQFRADILQSGASFILTTSEDYGRLQLAESWVAENGIQALLIEWDGGDQVVVTTTNGQSLVADRASRKPNKADEVALILFTSGTSGTKKVVPLTMHSIIAGIVFVMDSWGLTSNDICLNMMPLYHVGGLVRNIFAPIFSGGSTVCCPAFDPNLFWDVVENISATWYYASPSMHAVILAEAAARPVAVKQNRIRLACNAAGGLLPSLACQLRDTFDCIVLPSYGMTECMPISTPPLSYQLDREGTSGVSTGPEITILDWSESTVSLGTIGRICVRGEPLFPGYLLPDGSFDKSPFNPHGWFDTGDLGYMDEDGYLYITGRSKEVINRGGELISPFEVENAIMRASMSAESPIHGRISQALAFSARHDVLQEVVGVVLVTPPNAPRIDLKTLQTSLRSSLQQAKWPVFVVYMNDLPKRNNKVLRINLGTRLGLPMLCDDMPYLLQHWEGRCPPPDTELKVPIEGNVCTVDLDKLSSCIDAVMVAGVEHTYLSVPEARGVELCLAPSASGSVGIPAGYPGELKGRLASSVHNYMIPDRIHTLPRPFDRDALGNVDEARLKSTIDEMLGSSMEKLNATTQGKITKAFADILCIPATDIPANVDFFTLGGDSLRAGRLISSLRSIFNINIPISLVFNEGTVDAITAYIDQKGTAAQNDTDTVVGCSETKSATNPLLMLLQLVPIVVVYPLRRAFQWTLFMVSLGYTQRWPMNDVIVGRLFALVLSVLFARLVTRCIAPFVGIMAKWLIIGRHREGLYPMWGSYHTRWWLVQKIESLCGMGVFSLNDTTKCLYLRLMGAKVGKKVKLVGASLGEWDLLDIRDNVVLTRCVCRPFAVEGNTSMYLGRITIGENSSIGSSSIVAASSVIPPGTCIGSNSSSWELQDADEANRESSVASVPKPHWLLTCLFTIPLTLIAWVLGLGPWLGGLVGMVLQQPKDHASLLRFVIEWFTVPKRVGFHYLALVLNTTCSPFVMFIFAVAVKYLLDFCLGKQTYGPANTQGAVSTWRAALIKSLLPVSKLHAMTGMFGQHYEATSIAMRMLGAKIGKRVYWPGTGPSIGDYHLLDIGNDVVFGSRAHLVTTDGLGSDKIIVRDRAMIADRVHLSPGVEIGERTIMGSGALTKRGTLYPADSTYVGSKGGDAICLSTGRESTREKQAPRDRFQHMSSEDTLSGHRNETKGRAARTQIPHMSSDDTLADSGRVSKKPAYHLKTEAAMASDSDSESSNESIAAHDMSPFGRAFYLKLAPYYVLGPVAIFCYSTFLTTLTAFFWNIPSVASIQAIHVVFEHLLPTDMKLWQDILVFFAMAWIIIAILNTAQAILALAIVICSKWMLLGRRTAGNHDWDKTPYCQRWQIFLNVEKLRRSCFRGNGILGMLTGTHWIVLYFKALGANIGKDCALFANGRPSLMFTEPDLITLGDRVVVDDASVVAHINTRGKFDLNRLEIGDRCVLRSGSRLLSGAVMKEDSCLLEHTLIMGGDVVEARWTMQGWPAEKFTGERVKSA
ncbi:hypothetical protein B0I35DRAFT_48884 [Stachybotrys elegans]|uniref:Carrier domain-containing protein n=1 Tax=Stachybotrys elegans TaxID=80388 RepID=A0A8K0SMN3_9HYPO|nr:hypothetical protein B0I35DRAFT_48884 [Stachybotrys elegans]